MSKSKSTHVLLVVGALLLILGLVLFTVGMTLNKWDFKTLSTMRYEQEEYVCESAQITQIELKFRQSAIRVCVSEQAEKVTLSYSRVLNKKDEQTNTVTIGEENGCLKVTETNKHEWQNHIFNFNFGTPAATLTLPASGEYDLNLFTNLGNVKVTGGTYKNLTAETDLGDVELTDASAASVNLQTRLGDAECRNATVRETVFVQSNAGDVALKGVTAGGNATARTNAGSAKAENTAAKKLDLDTDCGDVKVNLVSADEIALHTSMGDVEGSIRGALTDFTITAKTSMGDCNLANRTGGAKILTATTDMGDIEITFGL